MEIVKARAEQLDEILGIYDSARKFMRESGNMEQWNGNYPSLEILEQDVANGKLHLCVEEGELLGVFYYAKENDPTYAEIFDGAWLNARPYGVMHRVAVAARGRGVASFCMTYCYEKCKNLKIDTHKDNIPMQKALERNGFTYCGIIHLENGDPRMAYQRCDG